MQHIPTTATALRKIKEAAKQIKIEEGLTLSQAQDLAAKNAGYEHFHHAVHCAKQTTPSPKAKPLLGRLSFCVLPEMYRTMGERKDEGRFEIEDEENLFDATETLDDFREEYNLYFEEVDEDDVLSENDKLLLKELIKLSRKLIKQEPAFLEGYSSQVASLIFLERFDEAILIGQPAFDAACALIPEKYKGYISYYELDNRPFYRLAANLALAYINAGKKAEGQAIAKRMLKWWPNDNMGFRFYLSDE